MAAPAIVLLPGMMLTGDLYAHQILRLSEHHAVVVGDLTQSDTVAALAQDVLRTAPANFALVGLSMGGIVALEIWRRARERVTHLALLDTTPYSDAPERQQTRNAQMEHVRQGGLRGVLVNEMKPLYLGSKHQGASGLRKAVVDMGLGLGSEVFLRQTIALRDRPGSADTLTTITCPTLVLCGREDRLCPPACHLAMAAAIPNADLTILSGCGHLSAMEEPEAVTDALAHLLRRAA
jgi:pimeloyl-ACP methyl ester carboxylesterase